MSTSTRAIRALPEHARLVAKALGPSPLGGSVARCGFEAEVGQAVAQIRRTESSDVPGVFEVGELLLDDPNGQLEGGGDVRGGHVAPSGLLQIVQNRRIPVISHVLLLESLRRAGV